MPPLILRLHTRELLDRSPQCSELDAAQDILTLGRGQPGNSQGQKRHAGLDEVPVRIVEVDSFYGVHQSVDQGGSHKGLRFGANWRRLSHRLPIVFPRQFLGRLGGGK
jgi:hypothetical protein